jgi:hypothetical protein
LLQVDFYIKMTSSPEWRQMRGTRKRRANTVYMINTRHYLDEKGDIEPKKGPARKLADFTVAVIAHASDFERSENTPGPVCFKCRKRDDRRVETGMTDDDTVVWYCPGCGTEGRVSNWRGTFWDLSQGMPSN